MYARVLALRNNEDVGTGLFTIPERPPVKGPLSFKQRGFAFIPIREAHIEFLAGCVYGRVAPKLDEVVGRAMVDENYLPLGVVLVHFEPDGLNILHAHFGRWLRVYPKDILRSMHEICDWLRERSIFILHAKADAGVEGSGYLLEWLGAAPTGQQGDVGPWFELDLRRCKI